MQARDPNHTKGVDVSYYQGAIDWPQVHDAGYVFAIVKATEGYSMTDVNFTTNLTGAKAAGMAVGCYHFFRATSPQEAAQEAQWFLSALDSVSGIGSLDIPPILDVETVNGLSADQLTACVKVWMDAVQQKTGVQPILYTYTYFANTYLSDPSLAAYKLHYAFYGDMQPPNAGPWTEWTFLQYSESETVPGINAPCDCNEFNGGVDVLLRKMDQTIAKEIIETCKAHYALAVSDEDRKAWHARAEEIRAVAGLPADS